MKISPQKIAVLNFSGNVGKSTLVRHLLAPRMPDAQLVSVESINRAEAPQAQQIRGSQFGQLQEELLTAEQVIVDVGSSNIEDFLDLMKQFRGSHEDFDLYVIPCVPAEKQQRDTIECIRALAILGVPREKIRVVFNIVPTTVKPTSVFGSLLAFVHHEKLCMASASLVVYESEIFGKVREQHLSIAELVGDRRDFKRLIGGSSSDAEKLALARQLVNVRLAQGVQENLNLVYEQLMSLEQD